eukprot:1184549-Prorocentrum_minimum.AAC.5
MEDPIRQDPCTKAFTPSGIPSPHNYTIGDLTLYDCARDALEESSELTRVDSLGSDWQFIVEFMVNISDSVAY